MWHSWYSMGKASRWVNAAGGASSNGYSIAAQALAALGIRHMYGVIGIPVTELASAAQVICSTCLSSITLCIQADIYTYAVDNVIFALWKQAVASCRCWGYPPSTAEDGERSRWYQSGHEIHAADLLQHNTVTSGVRHLTSAA